MLSDPTTFCSLSAAEAIYESREALEDYLNSVRRRRHSYQQWIYIKEALPLLEAELEACRESGAQFLAAELEAVRCEFLRRLTLCENSLTHDSALSVFSYSSDHDSLILSTETETVEEISTDFENLHSRTLARNPESDVMVDQLAESLCMYLEGHDSVPEEPVSSQQALPEPTRLSIFERLTALETEAADLSEAGYPLTLAQKFQLHGLYCTVNGVHSALSEYASDPELIERWRQLDDRQLALVSRIDPSKRYPIFSRPLEELTEDDWNQLGCKYKAVCQAAEAYLEFGQLEPSLITATRSRLINCIFASQKILYLQLSRLEAWDEAQQTFYAQIKSYISENNTDYLEALYSTTTEEELLEIAKELESAFEKARKETKERNERDEMERAKQETKRALLEFLKANPQLGANLSQFEAERSELFPLLDNCRNAKVPTSDKEICGALTANCQKLLFGNKNYIEYIRYAKEQREKKLLKEKKEAEKDLDKVDSAGNKDQEMWTAALRPILQGKSLLIVGGPKQNPTLMSQLKEQLCLETVSWNPCDRTTNASDFEADYRRSDIVMVMITFAGHDMSEKGRKWTEEHGGVFLQITKGNGFSSMLHHLYKRFCEAESGRPEPRVNLRKLPTWKSGPLLSDSSPIAL